jgi:hypothetical protein
MERCVLRANVGFSATAFGFVFSASPRGFVCSAETAPRAPLYPEGGMRGRDAPPPRFTGAGALNASAVFAAAASLAASARRSPPRFEAPSAPRERRGASARDENTSFARVFASRSAPNGFFVASLASSGTGGGASRSFCVVFFCVLRESFSSTLFGASASAPRAFERAARFPPASAFGAAAAAAPDALVFSAAFSRFASTFAVRPTSRTAALTSALASSAWSVFRGKS